MKIYTYYLLFVLPIIFAACNNDGDESTIVGKWKFQATNIEAEGSDETIREEVKAQLTAQFDSELKGKIYEFADNGTFTSPEGKKGSYTLVNDILTITQNDKSEVYKMVSLDDQMVKLRKDFTEEELAGLDETLTKLVTKYALEKQ